MIQFTKRLTQFQEFGKIKYMKWGSYLITNPKPKITSVFAVNFIKRKGYSWML